MAPDEWRSTSSAQRVHLVEGVGVLRDVQRLGVDEGVDVGVAAAGVGPGRGGVAVEGPHGHHLGDADAGVAVEPAGVREAGVLVGRAAAERRAVRVLGPVEVGPGDEDALGAVGQPCGVVVPRVAGHEQGEVALVDRVLGVEQGGLLVDEVGAAGGAGPALHERCQQLLAGVADPAQVLEEAVAHAAGRVEVEDAQHHVGALGAEAVVEAGGEVFVPHAVAHAHQLVVERPELRVVAGQHADGRGVEMVRVVAGGHQRGAHPGGGGAAVGLLLGLGAGRLQDQRGQHPVLDVEDAVAVGVRAHRGETVAHALHPPAQVDGLVVQVPDEAAGPVGVEPAGQELARAGREAVHGRVEVAGQRGQLAVGRRHVIGEALQAGRLGGTGGHGGPLCVRPDSPQNVGGARPFARSGRRHDPR